MIILNTQKRITAFCVLGLVLILINCSTTAETLQESKIHDMEFVLVAGKTPTPTPRQYQNGTHLLQKGLE